jgi:hypothetical protein
VGVCVRALFLVEWSNFLPLVEECFVLECWGMSIFRIVNGGRGLWLVGL